MSTVATIEGTNALSQSMDSVNTGLPEEEVCIMLLYLIVCAMIAMILNLATLLIKVYCIGHKFTFRLKPIKH